MEKYVKMSREGTQYKEMLSWFARYGRVVELSLLGRRILEFTDLEAIRQIFNSVRRNSFRFIIVYFVNELRPCISAK